MNPHLRPGRAYAAAALITLVLLITSSANSATQTLVGVDTVRFAWTPPTGKVGGYLVYLSVNGAAPVAYGYVTKPETTIPVTAGQRIAIQVAATGYDSTNALIKGPLSALSDSISIVPSPLFSAAGSWVLRCATCPALARRSVANASVVEAEAPGLAAPWRVLGQAKLQYGRDQIIWHNASTGQLAAYDSQFLAPIAALTGTGPIALRAIGATDVNNDGIEEFVTQRTDTGVVNVWRVIAGKLAIAGTIPGPTTSRLEAVTDFDRDGKVDLLWHDPVARTLDLWKMAKDPTLLLPLSTLISRTVRIASGVPTDAVVAATGDFNGNGDLDVLWRYSDGRLAINYLIAGVPNAYVLLVPVTGDVNRRVIESVDVGGTPGAEIAMQDTVTGLIWIVDPSVLGTTTRTMVVHPGNEWKVVGIGS